MIPPRIGDVMRSSLSKWHSAVVLGSETMKVLTHGTIPVIVYRARANAAKLLAICRHLRYAPYVLLEREADCLVRRAVAERCAGDGVPHAFHREYRGCCRCHRFGLRIGAPDRAARAATVGGSADGKWRVWPVRSGETVKWAFGLLPQ